MTNQPVASVKQAQRAIYFIKTKPKAKLAVQARHYAMQAPFSAPC
jgi:hypothetical protein